MSLGWLDTPQRVFSSIYDQFTAKPPQLEPYATVPLDITPHYNNQGASIDGRGPANFDGRGGKLPALLLPTHKFDVGGIHFHLPEEWGHGHDNVIAHGQVVELPVLASINAFHILYAGDWIDGESRDRFTLTFEDDTKERLRNWWTLHWLNVGAIRIPYHWEGQGINHNSTQLHVWSTPIRSDTRLRSITFPPSGYSWNRVHVFGLSVTPSLLSPEPDADKPVLVVRQTRFTTKRSEDGYQIVEVSLANLLPAGDDGWLFSTRKVTINSPVVTTIKAGVVHRLMASDEVRVEVLVAPKRGIKPGTTGPATIELRDKNDKLIEISKGWTARVPDAKWGKDLQSLERHEAPNWWSDAKFGIFIHWGPFSVPAWAPPGWYAEWYSWYMRNPAEPRNGFWSHHLKTYGKEVLYEDFIPEFTAAKFNASAWVELFENAGAKYFVLTTKHHDGFALFNTHESSHRNSLRYGPKRDLLRELFDAAEKERPSLHRGTYFSMPEWFHPDYAKYGFGVWPGHPARHAYDPDKFEPYTGYVHVKDYLRDVQLRQMEILSKEYNTEIMWCDIGGPTLGFEFAEQFFNQAQEEGREVTMDNRCSAVPDFDTPEYTRFSSVQAHHWETSEGIDPFSYGLNRQTKAEDYRSVKTIIHSLVDIASKNGNYLLNVGPTGEGEIIAPMVERLLEVGQWLKHSGECVYKTKYYSRGAEAGTVRFLTTPETFCIVAFERPSDDELVIPRQLPILEGDKIELLGASAPSKGEQGHTVSWRTDGKNTIITAPKAQWDAVKHAWAFRVTYHPR
ncbi:glycoside hydrolase [Auriculariales sp. MPI-PUGE-AT-0066]|nr:glycoside hydrolase [Auriculariales sp. MPI-PUGE-AT-0066]